jgi:hypothetical protein
MSLPADDDVVVRLKLRDLYVFFTAVDCGSTGKAAACRIPTNR